ncbi:MAG TPA: macro domain-containing protein [Terriglobales bacterium]|jgi:O-acetyl-ADP-ribose deacetylase (regulator of RNase III)|nr:macro domain-containing protein [Terriglobales bacterium]
MRLVLTSTKTLSFHGPADITKETTDAIVNAANSSLLGGGGVDGAIHRAGGPSILAECKTIITKIGHLAPGKAVITNSGRLPAKFIIHTVGPIYRNGKSGEPDTLANSHRESIFLADDHALQSLSFPAISTGAYGYPIAEAAQIAVSTAAEFLSTTIHLKAIRFVLFDIPTLGAYEIAAQKLHNSGFPCKIEEGRE